MVVLHKIRAELHVHTVLSPCAEIEMLPPLIVQEALEQGIQLIAITDHNATGNISAVQQAAQGTNLTVLPGMEVQTREEVHALCLFDRLEQAEIWQARVDAHLPDLENDAEHFGDQLIVDSQGDFVRREPRLLLTSCSLSLEDAWNMVTALGGLFIPAHVDRKAYGLLKNLGFVPREIPFQALEISRHVKPRDAGQLFPQLKGYTLIQSGDVHRLDEFLGVNELTLEAPTVAEIEMALKGEEGRSLRVLSRTL
jgi:PHP family Zn ribbon phosphoesterase